MEELQRDWIALQWEGILGVVEVVEERSRTMWIWLKEEGGFKIKFIIKQRLILKN